MATPQEIQKAEKIAETKRELQRRSSDMLTLFNPLKTDIICVYAQYNHVIPAGIESDHPRYVAEKALKEFADFMINKDEQDAVDKENSNRESKGFKPLSPEDKLDFVSGKSLLTSNKELRKKYMKTMYRGVSKEFGLDIPKKLPEKKDRRPEDIKLLQELDTERGTVFPEPDIKDVEVKESKEKLLKELDE